MAALKRSTTRPTAKRSACPSTRASRPSSSSRRWESASLCCRFVRPSLACLRTTQLTLHSSSSGAFSNVYKAIDRMTGLKVAVKVVRKYELNSSQVRALFLFRTLSSLSPHPSHFCSLEQGRRAPCWVREIIASKAPGEEGYGFGTLRTTNPCFAVSPPFTRSRVSRAVDAPLPRKSPFPRLPLPEISYDAPTSPHLLEGLLRSRAC